MNEKLTKVLDLIDMSKSIQAYSDDEELGKVGIDATEDFKSLRGLIQQAISDETMRCAAEIEGLPVVTDGERAWRSFAVRVLRGLKIY